MINCSKCGTEYTGAERFCPKDGTRLGTGERPLPKMTSIPPDKDPMINSIIQGRYKVIAQIGEGGMGVVYEAEHIEIEKKVALKVLRDDFSKRPEVVARFRQEARSASRIGNAHIVDVTDFGQLENGGVYFVMEHLQGKGLNEVIKNEVIGLERGVYIVLQIARALKAAHKLEIVHRDLKPENIFLVENDEENDFVKVLDFGIAKISDRDSEGQRLTKTGMIFGTPEYMSPEQAAGKPLDQRVDIYALGCIMFEMFTGRVPFEGETFMAVLTQHMFEPPPALEDVNPNVNIPENVKAVIYKAMAKDKDERYSDMLEFAEDLENAMTGKSIRENSAINKLMDYRITHNNSDNNRINDNNIIRNNENKIEIKTKKKIIITIVIVNIIIGIGIITYIFEKEKIENIINSIITRDKNGSEIINDNKNEIENKNEMIITKEEKNTDINTEGETDSIKTKTIKIEKGIVKVKINSEPEGGLVFIEGMGQVCSSTPCEVDLEEGKSVVIEVKKDEKNKEMIFTPSEQNKEIKIKINKKEEKRNKSANEKKKKDKIKKEDSLKIPEEFKKMFQKN